MPDLPKPEVILTHESDLDGLLAGLLLQRLARKMFDQPMPLEAFQYHTWKQRDLREKAAWVCDMAFEARLDKPNWMVVDHHATDHTPVHTLLIHDPNKSAALLAYELCCAHGLGSPQLDRLVHLNNIADLFLSEDTEFDLANDYASLVKVYQFWTIHALIDGQPERLLDHPLLQVMAVKRRVEDPLGLDYSRKNVLELSTTVGFVDTLIGNNNLIIHRLLETKATPYPVLMTLTRRGNGVVVASLRSRHGEALKIAEKLQGGGHPNACGATLPRSVRNIPDALIYLRQVLTPKITRETPLHNLEELFDSISREQKPG